MSGMDMLHNQRDKRRKVGNKMPEPLHRARTTPVNLPDAESESPEPETESVPEAPSSEPSTAGVASSPDSTPETPPDGSGETTASPDTGKRPPARGKSDKSAVGQPSGSELYPTTAYLELDEDKFIRRALEAGRYGKPKVTSASAVIRYAVRHLADHMTPEQVVAAIREAAPETSNQGRIRL